MSTQSRARQTERHRRYLKKREGPHTQFFVWDKVHPNPAKFPLSRTSYKALADGSIRAVPFE